MVAADLHISCRYRRRRNADIARQRFQLGRVVIFTVIPAQAGIQRRNLLLR